MNQYYIALYYMYNAFKGVPFVNSISQGLNTPDDKKFTVFPNVHINILRVASPETGISVFTFEVEVTDVRKMSNSEITDYFNGNDNEIDNLNTTYSILRYGINKMRKTISEYDVEYISSTEILPILIQYSKALDGWRSEITISVPDTINTCCNDDN